MFDLDGTLLDTLLDIANSVNAALTAFGFPTHPTDDYRYLVGDGRDCLINRVLPKSGLDDRIVSDFSTVVTAEYAKRWAENTKPYPGVPEMLAALEESALRKAVLSNKPHEFTRITVEKLLSGFSFDMVQGMTPSVPRKPDPAAALQIARQLQVSPSNILYLGDTNTDMQTANGAGMFAAGALWGFRTADELLGSGAKVLLEKPLDVLSLL
ncbi:MAG: HAD family hydrolase [Planctomycetota bacterium]